MTPQRRNNVKLVEMNGPYLILVAVRAAKDRNVQINVGQNLGADPAPRHIRFTGRVPQIQIRYPEVIHMVRQQARTRGPRIQNHRQRERGQNPTIVKQHAELRMAIHDVCDQTQTDRLEKKGALFICKKLDGKLRRFLRSRLHTINELLHRLLVIPNLHVLDSDILLGILLHKFGVIVPNPIIVTAIQLQSVHEFLLIPRFFQLDNHHIPD
jgi:hypothetical protein